MVIYLHKTSLMFALTLVNSDISPWFSWTKFESYLGHFLLKERGNVEIWSIMLLVKSFGSKLFLVIC